MSSCLLVDSNTLDTIHVTLLEDKEMDLLIYLSVQTSREKRHIRSYISGYQPAALGDQKVGLNSPPPTVHPLASLWLWSSCHPIPALESMTHHLLSWQGSERRTWPSIFSPWHLGKALRLFNSLSHMKDSHPSSLNNNFIIDNYNAGNYLKHFINPLLTVTNSLLIHSLLWHISASDKPLTASTISINRSRRCSLFISLLHGLWVFV